jgi:hypothetical protein
VRYHTCDKHSYRYYIEEKEDFGKCIYKFIAYEFVKDDEEYCIREDPYELYKVDDNYYIIQDSDVISIPKSAGQFLNSIENKITITPSPQQLDGQVIKSGSGTVNAAFTEIKLNYVIYNGVNDIEYSVVYSSAGLGYS